MPGNFGSSDLSNRIRQRVSAKREPIAVSCTLELSRPGKAASAQDRSNLPSPLHGERRAGAAVASTSGRRFQSITESLWLGSIYKAITQDRTGEDATEMQLWLSQKMNKS